MSADEFDIPDLDEETEELWYDVVDSIDERDEAFRDFAGELGQLKQTAESEAEMRRRLQEERDEIRDNLQYALDQIERYNRGETDDLNEATQAVEEINDMLGDEAYDGRDSTSSRRKFLAGLLGLFGLGAAAYDATNTAGTDLNCGEAWARAGRFDLDGAGLTEQEACADEAGTADHKPAGAGIFLEGTDFDVELQNSEGELEDYGSYLSSLSGVPGSVSQMGADIDADVDVNTPDDRTLGFKDNYLDLEAVDSEGYNSENWGLVQLYDPTPGNLKGTGEWVLEKDAYRAAKDIAANWGDN